MQLAGTQETSEKGLQLQNGNLYLDALELSVLVLVRQAKDRLGDKTG
jgi:hypothetical protein